VVGEAKTGREAIALTEELQPEIVVMDISMPDLNGLEAAHRIHKSFSENRYSHPDAAFFDQLLTNIVEAGARAYIMKSDADRDLISAVEALTTKRTFFTACAGRYFCSNGFSKDHSVPAPESRCEAGSHRRARNRPAACGRKKAARKWRWRWESGVKTAETHRANIMRKLEIHSVSEVVRYAVKNQIIEA